MSCDGDEGEMGWVVVVVGDDDDGGWAGGLRYVCVCMILIRLFFRFAICGAFHYSVQGYMKTYKVLYVEGQSIECSVASPSAYIRDSLSLGLPKYTSGTITTKRS